MKLSWLIGWFEARLKNNRNVFMLISFSGLAAYLNSLAIPFLLDDYGSIVNNQAIHRLFDFEALWKFYANRLVLYFTFSLNYALHDNNVIGYHVVNLSIHIVNGFLFYTIIKQLLELTYFKGRLPSRHSRLVAVFSAVLFLVHPIQVNAVSYIVQRTASLAALFYFSSILFFLMYRIRKKPGYFIIMMVFILLAMFTKENTITIPFMLLFTELLFFAVHDGTPRYKKLLIFTFIFSTLPVIPAVTLFLNGFSQSDPGLSFKASTNMDRMLYFYTELNVLVYYIRLMLLPDRQNFDYGSDWPVSATLWDNYSFVSLSILIFIAGWAVYMIKRNRLAAFGLIWFFTGLAVESSFISIKDVYFEHRLYFPCAGFVLFLAGVIFYEKKPRVSGKPVYLAKKPLLLFCIISFVCWPVYTGLTIERNYIYSDGIRLWTDVVSKAPGSDRAHSVLGTSYLDAYEANKDQRYLNMAEKEIRMAIDMNYFSNTAHSNLSKVYLLKGEYENCIEEAKTAQSIELSEFAAFNMGIAYERLGETGKALDAYLQGYGINSSSTFILYALGSLYYDLKDYGNSIRYYTEYLANNTFYDNSLVRKRLEEMSKQ